MKSKKRLNIGLFINSIETHYDLEIWKTASKMSVELNVNLIVFCGAAYETHVLEINQRNSVYSLANKKNLDGIILVGTVTNFIKEDRLLKKLSVYDNIPIVTIGAKLKNYSSVLFNNSDGINKVMEHLIDDHKYKNIAFISGMKLSYDAVERLDSYKLMLNKYNIKYNPDLVYVGDFTRFAGVEAVRYFLDEKKLNIDAIVSANDYMALGAIKELEKRNINVPQDICITGFDNILHSEYNSPSITSVKQPIDKMTVKTFELLLELIDKKSGENDLILNPDLILRESCGCSLIKKYKNFLYTESDHDKNQEVTDLIKCVINKPIEKLKIYEIDNIKIILKDIYNSITQDLKNNHYDNFISTLKKHFKENRNDKNKLNQLKELISNLLLRIYEKMENEEKKALVFKLSIFANEIMNQEIIKNLQNDFYRQYTDFSFLYVFNHATISTFNFDKLKEVIISQLFLMGIKKCYIFLYDKKKFNILNTMVSTDSNFKYKSIDCNQIDLVKEIISTSNERYSYIVQALYYENNVLGFIIFDYESFNGAIYENIVVELSKIIKNIYLIDELNEYVDTLEQKVEIRSQELKDALEQKNEFFINLAHETKTPLTLISSYMNKYITETGSTEKLEIIKKHIDILKKYMIDFLDFEKLQKGIIQYNHDQIVNFSALLESKSVLFKQYASQKNIAIDVNIQNGIYIKIDPYSLERIINNLLENAVKYNKNGGEIFIVLKTDKSVIDFIIKDTGIGINKNQLEHIFDPFFQISHNKQNIQGIGIGLNIVKKIIDQVNGEILIDSVPGKGSEFTVKLDNYVLKKNDKANKHTDFSSPININVSGKLKNPEYIKGRFNILVVEDKTELLIFLQENMNKQYNFFYAENGREALSRLDEIPRPHIIISDIMMDVMDGHEFYENIVKYKKYSSIPFIFLSAKSTDEDRLKGLSQGAIDFISKPFSIDELLAKVNSILINQQVQKETALAKLGTGFYKFLESKKSSTEELKDIKVGSYKINTLEKLYTDYHISKREIEVLNLLKKGLEYKQISQELGISIHTIDTYRRRLFEKCQVSSKVELLRIFNN